jgi:hypothetical protein
MTPSGFSRIDLVLERRIRSNVSAFELHYYQSDEATGIDKGIRMNTDSSDQLQSLVVTQVFSALRERLAKAVSSSAVLAELLERVTSMQKAQATPEEFKKQFYEFVSRAEEHLDVVRPFFPALVVFLPSRLAGAYGGESSRSDRRIPSSAIEH